MSSKRNKRNKRNKFKNRFKRLIAITFFVFVFNYYDPFGLDVILKDHSDNLFYHVIAAEFDNDHNDKITVVLLRENEIEEEWPVSYEYHADVLEMILDSKPKAIFVDLMFESTIREGIGELKNILKTSKVPIFLGIGRDTKGAKDFFNSELGENVIPISIVINSKRGLRYPLTNIPSFDELNQIVHNKFTKKLNLSLPAYLYCNPEYDSLVMPAPIKSDGVREKSCVREFIEEHGSQDFYITWSDMNGNITGSPLAGNCKILSSSMVLRFLDIVFINIGNGIRSFFGKNLIPHNLQECVPHRTLAVKHLFYDKDRKAVEKMIENKVVFYSVFLDNTNDVIFPPTHIALPGVYAHTMALENFYNYKNDLISDDYYLFNSSFISLNVIWTLIISLFLVILNEYFRTIYIKMQLSGQKKHKKDICFEKFMPLLMTVLITSTYTLVVVFLIFYFAMIVPFEYFQIAPLSGFDFALAIGFINLPSVTSWWSKCLEKNGLGED
jgi:hypothetical protein